MATARSIGVQRALAARQAWQAKAKTSNQDRAKLEMQAAVALATRGIRARFDSAQTTDENRRHWAAADGLSADLAASPGVRRILRNRARYEHDNNTYAKGIVKSLAEDCVGTGARLQLTKLPKELAREVEAKFSEWCRAVDLPEKMRTMRKARAKDGEAFAVLVSNQMLPTPVKLDLRLIEAEQVATVSGALPTPNSVDGIKFDAWGNPQEYEVLREHPGGRAYFSNQPLIVPAREMIHFFVAERPGQRRGISELTASLPLFAQLRRWTLSVLAAAETAADFAAILKTQDGASPDEAAPANAWERVEFERRSMTTLPAGWDISQLKAEQPTSTYAEVKHEIINEIARENSVPYNIAAGNSSSYNYTSGRLDFQAYERSLWIDRGRMEAQILARVFSEWKREAILIEGYLSQALRLASTDWTHVWYWPGFAFIDPESEAKADEIRLKNGTLTLADYWAREGSDWEEKLETIAKIEQRKRELAKQYGEATGGEVQLQALQGNQIDAILSVLGQIATKSITPAAAKEVLGIAFPSVDPARISRMADAIIPGSVQPDPATEAAPVQGAAA
jgi:lambda family phage portal protein